MKNELKMKDLDRADRAKLSVPARYVIWIRFGVHPSQWDEAWILQHTDLSSASHALPPGTKITSNSVEVRRLHGHPSIISMINS